jgi:DNA-binding MarR family transcriptional regulator
MGEKELKEAFEKIKEDMLFLSEQILGLKETLSEITNKLNNLCPKDGLDVDSTQIRQIQHKFSTNSAIYSRDKPYFNNYKGNAGVPADSQQMFGRQDNELMRTSKQLTEDSDTTTFKEDFSEKENKLKILQEILQVVDSLKIEKNLDQEKNEKIFFSPSSVEENLQKKEISSSLKEISSDLNNRLSSIKIELKDKFKALTRQEFTIFSSLYSLEEQSKEITYKDLALQTGLTESSIRDYISKLISKGIPVIKERINNKIILLRISPELRNIATLEILSKINSRQI